MSKLKAWPNGLGYDFGDWEIVKRPDGDYSASEKPAWFGGTVKAGTGADWHSAIMNAVPTQEFLGCLPHIRGDQ